MSKKRPMSQCDRTTFTYAKGKKWVVRVDLADRNTQVQYRRTTAAKFGRWYRAPFYSKDVFTAVEALHLVAYWQANPEKFDNNQAEGAP